jgi:hypothetical protein
MDDDIKIDVKLESPKIQRSGPLLWDIAELADRLGGGGGHLFDP